MCRSPGRPECRRDDWLGWRQVHYGNTSVSQYFGSHATRRSNAFSCPAPDAHHLDYFRRNPSQQKTTHKIKLMEMRNPLLVKPT